MNISRILLITLISSLYSVMSIAETYEVSIEPGKFYSKAKFCMWTQEGVDKFRGILMLNPGSNGDGRPQVEDEYWQAFAQKHNFALFGTFLQDHMHVNMMIEHYIKGGEGSGKAILDAIDQVAIESGHQELSYAPFLLWGMSAGGEINHEVAGSRELAVAYYEAVMNLPMVDDAMGYKALKSVTEEMGTVGNIYKHTIGAEDGLRKEDTTWLPDGDFAKK